MADVTDFEEVFGDHVNHVYTPQEQTAIAENRRSLGGQLFFDRLFTQLKLKNSNHYPPHSNRDLRALHSQIAKADIAEHFQQALVYYILLDLPQPDNEKQDPALVFRQQCRLPARYWRCIEGFWNLDRLDWTTAVAELTHPAVSPPTFSEEVLSTLLKHTRDEHPDLALAYYHCVNPPLASAELRRTFFSYLAYLNVTEAFFFLRKRPEHEQEELLHLLIREALTDYNDSKRADRGVELIELPFTDAEERAFEHYLLEGAGRSQHGARDAVMTRKVAVGKFQDALEVGKHLKGRKIDSMSWDPIKNAVAEGLGPRKGANVGDFA